MNINQLQKNADLTEGRKQLFRMRPIELSDASVVAGWYQQLEDVSIFDRHTPLPLNEVDVMSLINTLVTDQEKQKCRWFITESLKGEAVGMAGLENINMLHGHALLPVFIAQPWRRSGVGIRMACMMVDLAFKQLRLNRVATLHRADNSASEILLSRLGFISEGVSRQCWFSQGQYFDIMNVALLAHEWNNIRDTLLGELSTDLIVELGPRASGEWCWPQSM